MSNTQITPEQPPSGSSIIAISGPPESSGVSLEEGGVTIPNNPHHTINFVGAVVADDGSGVATVTVSPGSNFISLLGLGPLQNQYSPSENMNPGTINPLTDPALGVFTVIALKGADNQATRITGIDNTGVAPNTMVMFINHFGTAMDEGLKDCGQVVFYHLDTDAPAGTEIVCPGALNYIAPIDSGVLVMYGADSKWHVISHGGYSQIATMQGWRIYPNFQTPIVGPGQVDNWNPVGETTYGGTMGLAGGDLDFQSYSGIRVQTDAGGCLLTGLAPNIGGQAAIPTLGGLKLLLNLGPGTLVLSHLNGASTPGRQFICPNSVDVTLRQYEAAWVWSPGGDPNPQFDWYVINLAQDNTNLPDLNITGAVTTASLILSPDVTPAALPSVPTITHNWNPGSEDAVIQVTTNNNGSILGGLVSLTNSGTAPTIGEIRELRNIGSGPLILIEEDAGSTDSFRFNTPGQAALVVPIACSIFLQYADIDRWQVIGQGSVQGAPTLPINITPAIMGAGNVNDYDPTDAITGLDFEFAARLRLQGNATPTTITGLRALPDGTRKVITNYATAFSLANQSGLSSAANQFLCPGGATFSVPTLGSVEILYDGNNHLWLVLSSHVGGG